MRPPEGDGPDDAWLAEAGSEVAAAVRAGQPVPGLPALLAAAPSAAWRAALAALAAVAAAPPPVAQPGLLGAGQVGPGQVGPGQAVEPGSPAARLLAAIAGFPGSGAEDLRDLCLMDDATFAAASTTLRGAGLVDSRRFDVPDCWVLTSAGRRAVRG